MKNEKNLCTMYENHPKYRIFNSSKTYRIDDFWHFNQNVNVARFARNVEWNFFCEFQTLWKLLFLIYDDDEKDTLFSLEKIGSGLKNFSPLLPFLTPKGGRKEI